MQADKKLDLWTLPEVLIVHLKRFSFSRTRRTKLDNPVTFPLHGLDLSPYLLRPQVRPGCPDWRHGLVYPAPCTGPAQPGNLSGVFWQPAGPSEQG